MIKKSIFLFAIGLLLPFVVGSTLPSRATAVNGISPISDFRVSQSTEAKALTISEAWATIEDYAQKWKSNAEIVSLVSVDDSRDSSTAGQDGMRRVWRALLVDPGQPDTLFAVLLTDGQVTEEGKEPNASEITPLSGTFSIDSPAALALALSAKTDLGPAAGKGFGFDFSLEVAPNGSPAIAIRGVYQGTPAVVTIDANSGAILQSIHIGFDSGGILYSTDTGQTWSASDLSGKMINGVAKNPLAEDQAYAVASDGKQISLYQTLNGGKNWSLMGNLPESAGNWPYGIRVVVDSSGEIQILVGTASDLWLSKDGKVWSIIQGLPNGPKQWLASAQSKSEFRAFVSITAGDNIGLYESKDLLSWSKLADKAYRFSTSYDLQSVLATNEDSNQALLLTTKGETNSKVPGASLRAAGDFNSRESTVIESTTSGVGQLNQANANWTLPVPISSLASGPDFPQSHIVIAGGFRTGLYRSSDGGQSWKLVLADPSTVLNGSGEISDLAFLSKTNILAVNGGEIKWLDF